MTRNQLPEGVGKKIVEALKRQAEADITPVKTANKSVDESVYAAGAQNVQEAAFDNVHENQMPEENYIVENNDNVTEFDIKSMIEDSYAASGQEINSEAPLFKAGSETTTITFNNVNPAVSGVSSYSGIPLSEETKKNSLANAVTISIPTNVAVLKNLIASLPSGVSKQVGAQIIKQTLEAMGLPMAGVLKEAQEVQEELNANARECMLKVQEHKTNIMQLEQAIQEYQKNITQINDLVSLFLLTDRR